MECCEQGDWRLIQFGSALHCASILPTTCMWKNCVTETLNALINKSIMPIWFKHSRNMMGIRRAPKDCQADRSEEHTSELQSPCNLVCRLLLEKKKKKLNRSGR